MKPVGRIYRENLVGYVKERVEKRKTTFLLNYSKVSASQMNDLRKHMRKVGAEVFISKNSLARLAFKEVSSQELLEGIDGQTAFIWSDSDSVDVSKAVVKFIKEVQGILLRGGLLEGKYLTKSDLEQLSELPSRIVLLGMLLQTMQSPLHRLIGILSQRPRDLLSILKQYSERKEGK